MTQEDSTNYLRVYAGVYARTEFETHRDRQIDSDTDGTDTHGTDT